MLSDILKNTSEGRLIASSSSSTNNKLTETSRDLLVDGIATYCLEKKMPLTVAMCKLITEQICKQYPDEIPVINYLNFIIYNYSTSFIFILFRNITLWK